jgi:hypothetical protein
MTQNRYSNSHSAPVRPKPLVIALHSHWPIPQPAPKMPRNPISLRTLQKTWGEHRGPSQLGTNPTAENPHPTTKTPNSHSAQLPPKPLASHFIRIGPSPSQPPKCLVTLFNGVLYKKHGGHRGSSQLGTNPTAENLHPTTKTPNSHSAQLPPKPLASHFIRIGPSPSQPRKCLVTLFYGGLYRKHWGAPWTLASQHKTQDPRPTTVTQIRIQPMRHPWPVATV